MPPAPDTSYPASDTSLDPASDSTLPLVIVSHRGPLTISSTSPFSATKSPGGLATALASLTNHAPSSRATTWVCAASTPAECALTSPLPLALSSPPEIDPDSSLSLLYVPIPSDVHDGFYATISNPLLWFLQHDLYGASSPVITTATHRAFAQYEEANTLFANRLDEVLAPLEGRALVLVHDYHLYLLPHLVKERWPDAVVTHFTHIPFPGPDAWRTLPPSMRDPIFHGLLAADVVAFHTETSATSFALAASELLYLPLSRSPLTLTSHAPGAITPHTTHVRHYPISVDPASLAASAFTPEVEERMEELTSSLSLSARRLILRVDRTDPSKNTLRGFLAYEELLSTHPELHEDVVFLAFLQPSRQDLPEYSRHLSDIQELVRRINDRFSTPTWSPVDLRLAEDMDTALAAFRLADVLLVNPVADGMNLVAKEAVLVSKSLVLVLSETAGAAAELGHFALSVHPYDVSATSAALQEALTMPLPERVRRLRLMQEVISRNDTASWLAHQVDDLKALDLLPTPLPL